MWCRDCQVSLPAADIYSARAQHSVSVAEIVCGALPGTLERSLESFFGARVVQGYAMTECMPIACPLPRAGVNKPGSVRECCL